MIHPDYESFQIPAEVQEEYRKLVLQKRIVKWADGNAYDAEAVDAAIEAGEISTQLTEKEIERLKQILWAKAESYGPAKYKLTADWIKSHYSYEDEPIYGELRDELTAFVMENGTFHQEPIGSGYAIDPSISDASVVSALSELVSINGSGVTTASVVMRGDSPNGLSLISGAYHADPSFTGIICMAEFGSSVCSSVIQLYYSDSRSGNNPLTWEDLGFASLSEFESFRDALFTDEFNYRNGIILNGAPSGATYYDHNETKLEQDISTAVYAMFEEEHPCGLMIPTAAFLPEARQIWGSNTAVAEYVHPSPIPKVG